MQSFEVFHVMKHIVETFHHDFNLENKEWTLNNPHFKIVPTSIPEKKNNIEYELQYLKGSENEIMNEDIIQEILLLPASFNFSSSNGYFGEMHHEYLSDAILTYITDINRFLKKHKLLFRLVPYNTEDFEVHKIQ